MAVKTTPKKIRVAERQAAVLQLRLAGLPFSRIAEQLGISIGYANKLATRALAEYHTSAQSDAGDLLALSISRLDRLMATLWPRAIGGNLGAVDRVLAVEQRRARLLGLEAPTRLAPVDPSGKREYQGAGFGGLSALLALYDKEDEAAAQAAGTKEPHRVED